MDWVQIWVTVGLAMNGVGFLILAHLAPKQAVSLLATTAMGLPAIGRIYGWW